MKLFRHYKNKYYKVTGSVKHSETLEEFVVYETRYDSPGGKNWIRPKEMFHEKITVDGKTLPRFSEVQLKITSITSVGEKELGQIRPIIEKVFGMFDAEGIHSVINNRKNFHLILGMIDEQVVGFKLGYQDDIDVFYSWLGGVDPEFQSLGIASELMKVQHQWCLAQGFKKVQTKTKNKWREMIILNLNHGFQIIGTYTDKKGETKILLEKDLL